MNNSSVTTRSLSQAYFDTIKPETQAKRRIPIWEAEPVGRGEGRRGEGGRGEAGRGGGGRGSPLTAGLQGLPIVKPPYGVLTAIDLNSGALKFRVPHGDTPDPVRTALERLGITYPEKTGQGGSVGPIVTKTLVKEGGTERRYRVSIRFSLFGEEVV